MKSTKIFFLIIIYIPIIILIFQPASAMTFKPQVGIPGFSEVGKDVPIQGDTIGKMIKAIYNYAIGIAGILAVVVMMVGGVVWITSAGNQERVGTAKSLIGASATGLLLVLSSYAILKTVNPNLTEFKSIDPMIAGKSSNRVCCSLTGPVQRNSVYDNKTNTVNYFCPPGSEECPEGHECIKEGALYHCMKKPVGLIEGAKICTREKGGVSRGQVYAPLPDESTRIEICSDDRGCEGLGGLKEIVIIEGGQYCCFCNNAW